MEISPLTDRGELIAQKEYEQQGIQKTFDDARAKYLSNPDEPTNARNYKAMVQAGIDDHDERERN